jgi:hypothetical protein
MKPMNSRLAAALLLALAAACVAGAPAPRTAAKKTPSAPGLSLLGSGPLIIPRGARVDGLRVGGLSGIARAADGTYLAVVDNEGDTPARVFRLAFAVSERGVAPLPGKTVGEVPVAAIRLEGLDGRPFDGKNFDGEGIAIEPSGRMLLSSETEPSIRELSLDGKVTGNLPVPALFLGREKERMGIRGNLGFESLALSAQGDILWTANERALKQDAPDDATQPSPVRLLRYGRRGDGFTPGAQLVYQVEPIDPKPGRGFAIRGLSELLVLPDGDLLALEREYVEGRGFKIQLYRVSTAGATDVSGFDSLASPAGRTWTPVRKTLVFDFAGAGFSPDNLEGMTFGPSLPDGSRTLVLVSDNNFELFQRTQIVALRCPFCG